MQARLDEWMIEDAVLLATSHKRKPGQIREHGSGPILTIEPQQGTRRVELIRCEIATDGGESLAQLFPVSPIAPVAQ